MALYPGWDSLDSVRTWHTLFEISGIAFLALLVGAEILAFQYGHRKDELTAIAESAAETKRRGDTDAAEARRKAEVDGLQNQLSDAAKKVSELQRRQLPRRLSESQKATLLAALVPYRGQTIKLSAAAGDAEANTFGNDFVAVFNTLGIEHKNGPQDMAQVLTTPPVVGIQIRVSEADALRRSLPSIMTPFMNAMMQSGIVKENTAQMDSNVPDGALSMLIGSKP